MIIMIKMEAMKEARMEELQVKRMNELGFLLQNIDQSTLCNDEQIADWENEFSDLANIVGIDNLECYFIEPIFEQVTYKVYNLDILNSDILILFDDCTIERSHIIYLTEKENKQLFELCEEYYQYWYNDEYDKMEDLQYFIEREFLGIAR